MRIPERIKSVAWYSAMALVCLVGILVTSIMVTAFWRMYVDFRDMRSYQFDDQAMSWLDALPNTSGACLLDALPGEGGPFAVNLLDGEVQTIFKNGYGGITVWRITRPTDAFTAPELKARFCDGCIASIARTCGDTQQAGWIVASRGGGTILPVQDHKWALFSGPKDLYAHVDRIDARTFEVKLLLMA